MPRGGVRKGAGRKPSPHRATVQVRVSPEVFGRVEEDCARTGESQAEWVRQAVLERLERRRGMDSVHEQAIRDLAAECADAAWEQRTVSEGRVYVADEPQAGDWDAYHALREEQGAGIVDVSARRLFVREYAARIEGLRG
jgi:hypothetical protein